MTGRVAILTGRSDPARTGLWPGQLDFLKAVVPPDMEADPQGYPWVEGALPERDVVLPLASLRNLRVWGAARLSPRFASEAREALGRMRARGVGTVIAGSCGLDILCAGWDGLALRVIALGPVRRQPKVPGLSLTTIIGRRDLLSRALFRAPPDHWVPGGHMDYWSCPTVRDHVRELLGTSR